MKFTTAITLARFARICDGHPLSQFSYGAASSRHYSFVL
jgi:hypothetical protein